jgi:hypothetical protein
MASTKKNLRTFFAIHCYMWAVVATVFIIDTMQTPPVDKTRLALWAVVALIGVGSGSLLIRRPRI